MTYSEIILTFDVDLIADRHIGFTASRTSPVYSLMTDHRWVDTRTGPGQVPIGTPTGTPGERSAIWWTKAFNIDHNWNQLLFETIIVSNVVHIRSKTQGVDFSAFFSNDDYQDGTPVPNSEVTEVINNYSGSFLSITNLSYNVATTNPICTHYKISITTNILIDSATGTFPVAAGNTNNPIVFELPRRQGFSMVLVSGDGQAVSINSPNSVVPGSLVNSDLQIKILNVPSAGATVTALFLNSSNLVLDYSLTNDGFDWQSSNVFPGIVDGSYTMYVRDQFLCIVTQDFTVNENNIFEPYLEISGALSIRYKDRVSVSDCGPYRNDDNSLSHEEFAFDPDLAYSETQQFQSCDSIITQLKSNYSTILAKVIKEDLSEDSLTVTKMTKFIGIKDARDATKYNIGNGQSGIYFTAGNIYDYDTETDTGDDYTLNGGLPEWALIGNYLSLGGAFYEILKVIYDESLSADVIVINLVYTNPPVSVLVKSQFNRQIYDVYEFTVPMSNYNNQNIHIQIDNQDPNFIDRIHMSECINIKTRQEETVEIIYYNNSNTDIYYKTGIKNLIRTPILFIRGDHEDESEDDRGDTESSLRMSEVYEKNEYELGPVTKGGYRQLIQALSHKFITLDGIAHIKAGSIEKEGPLEESNLYIIKANMLKTSAPFTSKVIGIEPEIIDVDETLEVPNLVITNDGKFISYSE